MPEPEQVSRWYQALWPIAERGGPVLTLLLGLLFAGSLWWGMSMLRECVNRNHVLSERLITQQEKFHQDVLLRLAHCPPASKD
jgi:hypothetical protein